MIVGFWLFIGQLFDFVADILELPSALMRQIGYFFIGISGINGSGDEQE